MSEFGTYLKELRQKSGVSQRQLARALGCSPAYIGRIETNGFIPSEEVALKLAKELQADPDVLLVMAGKVSTRLLGVLQRDPQFLAELLRDIDKMPQHARLRIRRVVKDGNW